ncbi:MAG: hypothetical protein H6650_10440 [Ardenticatenales bacterium]|nr:hypothetical protein [Ardenticatenales bacterium]
MTQKTNSFGELLSRCRRNSTDPVRGGPLTQERLAELLENTTGIKYSSVTISNWERDDSQIHKDDRPLLVGLLKVLHMCGGVKTRESADQLLRAGNYRHLNGQELTQIGMPPSSEESEKVYPDNTPPRTGGETHYDLRQGTFFQGDTTAHGDFMLGGKTYIYGDMKDSTLYAGEANLSQSTADSLSSYTQGVERLLAQLDRGQPQYSEVLSYQRQLADNIQQARLYGDPQSIRVARTEIIANLNRLSLDTLNMPFNKLCAPG